MASPELLQLVENCPTGAETLIARILNIITDKGSVMCSSEVKICYRNYAVKCNIRAYNSSFAREKTEIPPEKFHTDDSVHCL